MQLHKRKNIRLKEFDYSSRGAYFITICTHDRKNLFVGAIHESPELQLNPFGQIVDKYINQLNTRFDIKIDKYVIMPNHIHLIIVVEQRAIRESPLRSTISKAVGYLKMNASRDIHNKGYTDTVWQRSFYDHVIRNEQDYQKIRNYIDTNPAKWQEDKYYK